MAKFEEQGGKCAISGIQMTMGKDAELDHIIPAFRGGQNALENIQWVLKVCNRMKDSMLEEEFFELIEKIYNSMKERNK